MSTQASSCVTTIVEPGTEQKAQITRETRTHGLDRICFYLFVLGGLAGLAQFSSPLPFGLGFEMVAIGRNLATNGSFANPFAILQTGPTAVNPPLYPFLLGILFKVLKSPELVLVAAAIGNVVMNALAASWLPRVSLASFGTATPGVWAALFWLAAVQLMPAWDVSYTAAGLILFCWLSASAIESSRPLKAAVALGMLAGALLLLNPSSSMVMLPWLAYLVRVRPDRKRRSWLFAMTVLGIACLPVCSWMLRNVAVLGAPVLRTNLGMTLYVSNNDCAQPSLVESGRVGCYQTHHPNESALEAQALRSQGEIKYDQTRVADSMAWIRSHPERFQQLTIQRFSRFWFPLRGRLVFPTYAIWLGTALSIPGLLLLMWRRSAVALFIKSVLLAYPLMYYMVVWDVRYRYPCLWLSFLAAGYLMHAARPQFWLTRIRSRFASA